MLKSVVTERKVWCVTSPTALLMSVFYVTFNIPQSWKYKKVIWLSTIPARLFYNVKPHCSFENPLSILPQVRRILSLGFLLHNKTNPQTTLKTTLKQPKPPTYLSSFFIKFKFKKSNRFSAALVPEIALNWSWLWRDVIRQHCPLASTDCGSSEVWSE